MGLLLLCKGGAHFLPPSDVCVRSFYLLYCNKTLLHKSSEQSSLVSGPGLNSPPEAKNPGVFSWVSNNLSVPLGCSRAPALSALLRASNLHWSSVLHMVIYVFQRYSLKSSHPRLLPHSPEVCSLYLCLFCCLAYRVIVTIFLNSIYMH